MHLGPQIQLLFGSESIAVSVELIDNLHERVGGELQLNPLNLLRCKFH